MSNSSRTISTRSPGYVSVSALSKDQPFCLSLPLLEQFQRAGFMVAEIKDVIWTAIDCFMKQFYFADPELQPPPRSVPTELRLPWLVAPPAERDNADGAHIPAAHHTWMLNNKLCLHTEHHPVDIFIRLLRLRVGWVDCTGPWRSPRLWQPLVAGVGNVKVNGIVMGPRLLKARLTNQPVNHRAAAGAGGAEPILLTSIGYITKEGRKAEADAKRGVHPHCRIVCDCQSISRRLAFCFEVLSLTQTPQHRALQRVPS